ncbi:MAG: type 1 glutamine amidotransferase [Sedimentisphaerales bacterium]|nr:type 1 glutamine amidotransferase [Sedimentisphaerales bacterium]
MRIHSLEHVPFEDSAHIGVWARGKRYAVTRTAFYRNETLPELNALDALVIMGGPMNVYEYRLYPWLRREKEFISEAIAGGKVVIGVCLGAQLVANVLGGRIIRNPHKEIGWFEVSLTPEAQNSAVFSRLPQTFNPFHWHGDTFTIPPGAQRMAGSHACAKQAFQYGRNVFGLQFHLEYSRESIEKMLAEDELKEAGDFIQTPDQMRTDVDQKVNRSRELLYQFLDAIEEKVNL